MAKFQLAQINVAQAVAAMETIDGQ